MAAVDEMGDFDPFFYCTHHADLKGFSSREARRHYLRLGRREARHPNPAALLARLQAQEGPLPSDFDGEDYVRLNPDLQQTLRYAWQPAEHYLLHGRHQGRRYTRAPAHLTYHSATEYLRRRLVQAFGEALVDEAFVLRVHRAASSAAGSATLAAPLMDPVLLGRWLLSPLGPAVDFASLRDQLVVLFRVVFELSLIVPRTDVEMEVLNRLRRQAIATTLFDAGADRPPVTLLILTARAVSDEPFPEAPDPGEAAGIVARFFTRDVPRLALERYVTPGQRARLRARVSAVDPRPLAAALLEEVEGPQALPSASGPEDLAERFLEDDVWPLGMDYVLSADQLTATQVQVRAAGDGLDLYAPGFLAADRTGDTAPAPGAGAEAARAWLQDFVVRGREDQGLPQALIGASASIYALTGALPGRGTASAGAGSGSRTLRAGDLLTFGQDGAGRRHLIGRGWHNVEVTHVWSAATAALLAINLDEADLGPLDLFVRLSPGPIRRPQVTAWWNTRPVGALPTHRDGLFTLHCHLGSHHRGGTAANILCLGIDDLFKVPSDERHLGVALYDLMLVRR